jgi:hypothetical protein
MNGTMINPLKGIYFYCKHNDAASGQEVRHMDICIILDSQQFECTAGLL